MKQDFAKYIALEPYEFDQGDQGWRELDKQKEFLKAAQVIEQYLDENKEKIKKYTKEKPEHGSVLVFHAGQLYFFDHFKINFDYQKVSIVLHPK